MPRRPPSPKDLRSHETRLRDDLTEAEDDLTEAEASLLDLTLSILAPVLVIEEATYGREGREKLERLVKADIQTLPW